MNTANTENRNSGKNLTSLLIGAISLLTVNSTSARIVLAANATASDKAAYENAVQYLSKSAAARDVISALENSANTYTITFNGRTSLASSAAGNEYDPATRTVYWIPTYGFQWKKGSSHPRVTPALGLIHEMGHASHHELDSETYQRNSHSKILVWDTREEEQTVHNIEHNVAKDLGEPLRKEHSVSGYVEDPEIGYYQTESSISIAPATQGTFATL